MRLVIERNEQSGSDPNIIEVDSALIRDFLAGCALIGTLRNEKAFDNPSMAAVWAYEQADAMMEARYK